MVDPELIRRKLVVDEAQIQERHLDQVAEHLSIDSAGNVHLHDPSRYIHRDALALHLLGRRYAKDAGLAPTDAMEVGALASVIGIDSKVAAARLGDLRGEGKVETVERGTYRIVMVRAAQVLAEVNAKTKTPTKEGMGT
jgi:hypothetical protein